MPRLTPQRAREEARPVSGKASWEARVGPRPLVLHAAQAELAWRRSDPDRLARFYQGVRAYRDHPYRRARHFRPAVWRAGAAVLEDYGPSDGWPLLVVPSMINRAYVLDLMPGASLLAFLRQGGLRPFLLDWGLPGAKDRRLSLDECVGWRLEAAFDWLVRETGRRPLVLGYCMGGTLATALACRRPSDCAGLALLASPWDFQAEGSAPGPSTIASHVLAHGAGMVGSASIDLLQSLFAMIDPMTVPNKFAAFADLDPAADAALRFVAIEDWLNDGVPLGADIAARCLIEWYGHNAPALGQWRVFGRKVQPEALTIPAVLAIPAHDRIVPAASALALAAALPGAEIIRPKSGHIGMVAGRRARDQLWQPLLAWLLKIAALQKK